MKLSKGIIQVIIANILNLIISLGNGFLLPKYLSIESYANLKTFLLYISYVGIMHIGYIDGIYINYGGKTADLIEEGKFDQEKRTLVFLQICVTFPVIIVALLLLDFNLLLAAVCVLPQNMVAFYQAVYQATGEFKEYRYITNLRSILIFVGNLILLFLVKTNISFFYIASQVAVYFIVWFFYERKNKPRNQKVKISLGDIWFYIRENIHLGVIIMLGNFVGAWITSIDRWFVKSLCSVAEFAYYSFAVTMLRLINAVITAFSITLYNFFCKISPDDKICRLRRLVLVIGAVIIAVIFPLEIVLRSFLGKYIDALPVIRVLFAAQFIMIEVNAVYMNLYKAFKLQRKYLIQMAIVTVITLILNVVMGYLMDNHIVAYAIATFFTAIVWLIICQIDLAKYKMSNYEWMYVLLSMVGYFVCGFFNAWIGGSIYVCWILLETILLFPAEVKYMLSIVKKE